MSRCPATRTALFAVALLAAPLALAQGAPPPGKAAGPCKEDVAALCPNLQPGPGGHAAIARCLEAQQDKLSPQCKTHLDEMRARAEAAKEACKPDVEKFCAGVAEGGGRIMQCLHQHASELSDACKAQWPKHPHPPPPPATPPASK
jgi:hypothetical protein